MAKRVDKSKMACNKPRASTRPGKKKMVKGCEGGKEKIIHFGAKGYGHNYSAGRLTQYWIKQQWSMVLSYSLLELFTKIMMNDLYKEWKEIDEEQHRRTETQGIESSRYPIL